MFSGTLLGNWLQFNSAFASGWNCITGINGLGAGSSYNLYWGGVKPTATFAAPGFSSIVVDGLSHTIWTTNALQAAGLGYLVRWRVQGLTGTGQWVTPPANWGNEWMPPATAGIDFWRALIYRFPSSSQCNLPINIYPNSLQEWWNLVNSSSQKRYCLGTGVEVAMRYVLIKHGSQIASQLDPVSYTVSIQSEILKNRPQAIHREFVRVVANGTVTITPGRGGRVPRRRSRYRSRGGLTPTFRARAVPRPSETSPSTSPDAPVSTSVGMCIPTTNG